MWDAIIAHEPVLRLGAFVGVLGTMMLWEWATPRRHLGTRRAERWVTNLGIVAIDAVVVRVLFPVAAVGVAWLAAERGWGLFNAIDAPLWLAAVASVVLLDLAVYGQHVATHKIPILWRLHRMHHADVDIDTTTGIRFHPIEIALSMLDKMAAVIALGAPPAAVVLFEVLLNGTAMFNHANVRLPAAVDRVLRTVIVTPDMHRVHHSVYQDETDTNYGFSLSVWDRLFGTYRPQPRDGHTGMVIGLSQFRAPADRRLHRLLIQPFLDPSRNN